MHDNQSLPTIERMMMANAKSKGVPINGSIELLPLCNMNCDMCYVKLSQAEVNKIGHIRTKDEWLSIAEEMKNAGVLFLLLTGGEPLLFPGFKELFIELKHMGMILTVNTNATLLDEKWADFFAKYKPRRINITLYGTSNETYEKLCHYKNGYDKTIRAIQLLRERDIDVRIGTSVTKTNLQDVKRIVEIAKVNDAPVNLDCYMMPATRERELPFDAQVRLNPEDAARVDLYQSLIESSGDAVKNMVNNVLTAYRNDIFKDNTNSKMSCMAGGCSFTINWTGNMKPCVITPVPEVNVFEKGFVESWKEIHEYCTKLNKAGKCVTCNMQHICPTCPVAELVEEGKYGIVPKYLCAMSKAKIEIMEEMERTGNYEEIL